MNRKNIESIVPLSPAQQGMLFESIRASESGIHIEQTVHAFRGKLDIAAFERAWQWVTDRHAILRTGFVWKEQVEPLQIALRSVAISINQQDWRELSSSEQETRLEAYLGEDRPRGFELSKAPLMRMALFHLGDENYRFVWTHHH